MELILVILVLGALAKLAYSIVTGDYSDFPDDDK